MLYSRIARTGTDNPCGTVGRWPLLAAASLILLAASAGAVKADNIAYMTTNTGEFGTIDLNTGVFSELGYSGTALGGLGVANGTLYAMDGSSPGILYTVDPANGSLAKVATSSILVALFGSTTSGLYAVALDGNLYSINAASGVATLRGQTGFHFGLGYWSGMSTNSSTLYASQAANIYTIDTGTGAPTLVGLTGGVQGPQMGAMVMEGGVLYGGEEVPSFSVATLDPTTGAATAGPAVSGTTGQFYGLAPYPLPHSTAFMGTITGDFGTIDLTTGVFSKLGNSGVTLAGMAVANGTLFGTSYEKAPGTLYTIDPASGSVTVVGTSAVQYFAFGSTTSGLYVVGVDASLYSIDPASGATTLIGPTGFALTPGVWYSLSTNSPTLYFADAAKLYMLDTSTGTPTLVGSTGGPQMGALLMEGGILYGGENSPSLSVATLDSTTGAATTGPTVTGTTGSFYALAPSPLPTAAVTLDPSTSPGAGDPGVTNLTVVGHGFPNGTITPGNVTVTLNPTTVGGGPSGTATASLVTVVSGSTESVTFQIPATISVPTPTSYQVSIAGTNSTGNAFQSSNTAALTVSPILAIITSSPLPTGTVNVNYSQTLAASGGTGSYTWSIGTGILPGGLSLNAATGAIGGLPSAAGTSNFTIQVTDSNLATAATAFALTIDPALAITTASPLPAGTMGVNYSQTLAATGGSGIYTWSVAAGTLPGGLSLNTATGLVSGTPNTPGTSHFAMQVTDSNLATATKSFALTVHRPALTITTSSPLPTGTVNMRYSETLAATGGSGQYVAWGVIAGALPGGLSLNAVTGVIGGLPTTAGTSNFTVEVVDSTQVMATKAFAMAIDSVPAITTASPLPRGAVGVDYSQTLAATGGSGIYSWSISSGSFPAGLSLDSATGQIGGAPTIAGNSRFTIKVTDSLQATATKVFGLTVNPPPQITTLSPNWGRVGQTLGVIITGAHTNFVPGSTQASFGAGISVGGAADGQPGPVTVNSPTKATAQVVVSATAALGSLTVTVTTGEEQASLVNGFSIFPAVPTLTVLHNFLSSDGATPNAGVLMGSGGVLYGTTVSGGPVNGTVFSLTPPSPGSGWTEADLLNFFGSPIDGAEPEGALAMGNGGALYSTTYMGGAHTLGTVFSLTPPPAPGGPWTETVLHNFAGVPGDGALPVAGVTIGSGGVLYGTTASGGTGGASSVGTVFSLTPPASPGGVWTETVLHNFISGGSDGFGPNAGVAIGSGGVLYGTTDAGGAFGWGTVFSLTPPASPGGAWIETVLYNFSNGIGGAVPYAGVTIGNGGVLYGTTYGFGTSDKGTVYMLTPPGIPGGTWSVKSLHTFTGYPRDGANPYAGVVIGSGGVLYGATQTGGSSSACGSTIGCGTVFSLTPPTSPGGAWTETVLHSFTGSDGFFPRGSLLVDSTGLLYGTTAAGGSGPPFTSPGTVFSLTP
jgi:uncharacterized repeat protein (TIGR03803 family)